MSTHQHATPLDRDQPPSSLLVEVITLSLHIRGCTCDPDFSIEHTEDGPWVKIGHDDWCPVLK